MRTPGPSEPAFATMPPARRRNAAINARRPNMSILHRFINQLLQCPLHALALGRGLLQQHEEHVLLGVDHEIAAGGAVPFQFAEIAGRRRFCVAGIGADRKSETEAETIAGEVEIIAIDARLGADLVGHHQLERLGLENRLAVETAALEQHLRKALIIGHGRPHTAAGELDLLDHRRIVDPPDPEIAVVRHRLRQQLLLLGIGDEEAGIDMPSGASSFSRSISMSGLPAATSMTRARMSVEWPYCHSAPGWLCSGSFAIRSANSARSKSPA